MTTGARGPLSADQVDFYNSNGYLFPDFRLPSSTVETIRERHQKLLVTHPDHPEFRDNCPALLELDREFLEYARNDRILDMVEQLIGQDIALWNMSFFAKPAFDGKRTPWHQDGEYWPIRPLATCTVWIAIDDATIDNGCMRFIPGSHRPRKLLKHDQTTAEDVTLNLELQAATYDESNAVDVVLEAGQISLHDVYLAHGSGPNSSPNPRRGMTLRLMPTTSVFDRDLARDMQARRGGVGLQTRPIFQLRGRDLSGRNDFEPMQP